MPLVLPPNWFCMYNSCLCTLKFWVGHWLIFSSAAQSCLTLRPHGLQHTRFPCPSPTLGACSNWSPSSWMKSIQLSHPPLFSSSPTFNLSQHQGLFQWVLSSHQVAKVLELQLQHQSLQWIFRIDFLDCLDLLAVQGTLKSLLWHHTVQSINSLGLSLLYSPALTSSPHDWIDLFGKVMSLLFNMLSRFVIAFLPKIKHLLIPWLQSPSAVISEPKKIKCVTVSFVSSSICHEVMGSDAMIFLFFQCWVLSQPFHSPLSPSSRVSLVPLCFLPQGWYHLHIWGYWYFSQKSCASSSLAFTVMYSA